MNTPRLQGERGGVDGFNPGPWERVRMALARELEEQDYLTIREAVRSWDTLMKAIDSGELLPRKHSGQMLPHGFASDCELCHQQKLLRTIRGMLLGCQHQPLEVSAHGRALRCGDTGLHAEGCPAAKGEEES